MGQRKQDNDVFQTIALFGLVFFGFYFVFSSISSNESENTDLVDIRILDRQVDRALNKSLQEVYNKQQLRNLDVNTRKVKLTEKFKEKFVEDSKAWVPDKQDSLDLYEEDMSKGEVSYSSLSVETQLRSQISEQKEREAQARRDKLEYIRKYKENAAKDGWIVELNENLEVISARPVNL